MFDPRVSVLIILIIKPNLKWFTEFGFGTNLKNKKVFLPFFIYNVHKSQFTCFVFCMWAIHLHSKGSPSWPGLNINRSRGRWNWLSVLTLPLPLPLDMKSIKNVHNSCDRIHVFDSPTICNHCSLELDSDAPRTRAELVHLVCFKNLHSSLSSERDRPIGLLG